MKKLWILIVCLFLFSCKSIELDVENEVPRSKSEPQIASSMESFLEKSSIEIEFFDVILSEETREILLSNQLLGDYSEKEIFLQSELYGQYPKISFQQVDQNRLSSIFEKNQRHFVFLVTTNIYPSDYEITFDYQDEIFQIDLKIVTQEAYYSTRTVMIIISIESILQYGIVLRNVT
jgi:hypothetical protein